jgi:ADP-ribose pyrophosphatase
LSDLPTLSNSESYHPMVRDASKRFPRILSAQRTVLSKWVTLVEKCVVASADDAGAIYHSVATPDYVSILAVTSNMRVALVRQFRPALDRFTLEFPGGMCDSKEEPAVSAIRELAEEAGLQVATAEPLALFHPDSGRLGNRMWTYFARDVTPIRGWHPEPGVEYLLVDIDELYARAIDGSFDHGPHLAMLGMATIKGLLPRRG